ncbi:hypothetical protein NC653_003376 [Populus alba x Populus x berolinensis]|uniref:Uncharacterized protein n=1 Tax=Populus alba x Populus x berolinensis TaxID=444605 RepID=A0AAD6RRC3_9ROSI|nr:hypothetical protein NC653_003376 [Populus alba x Populus x berolinensis]
MSKAISSLKFPIKRQPCACLKHSLVANLQFNKTHYPLLMLPLYPEPRLSLLILLVSPVRLGFCPNTKIEPCRRGVLLPNLFIILLLVIVMKILLVAPD